MFGEAILLGAATIVAAATVITTIIAATPTLQQGFAAIGAAIQNAAVGVYNGAVNIAKSFAADYSDIQEKEKSDTKTKDAIIKKPVVFPANPNNFNPRGLTRTVLPGTKNGKIIQWKAGKEWVFRWDENTTKVNGSHYHVNTDYFKNFHFYPG